jgi:ABC-2 type transport system permease protein
MGISEEMLVGVSNAEKAEIIIDGFGMFVTGMMSLIALIPVLMAVLKLRSEEVNGRLEHILTRSVSRVKYFSGFIVISFALSVVMQLATVFGLYFCTGAVMGSDNPFVLTSLMKASLVYLPAFWIIRGRAVLLVGLCPKATGAAWGYYGFVCLATLMGGMGVLPEWLTKLSPIGYVPEIRVTGFGVFPSDDVNVLAMLVMTVIAAGLTAAGLYFYQKRDLAN